MLRAESWDFTLVDAEPSNVESTAEESAGTDSESLEIDLFGTVVALQPHKYREIAKQKKTSRDLISTPIQTKNLLEFQSFYNG